MASSSHDLTLKNYQKQLKDNLKSIYEIYMELLKTKTEHVNFEVQVKAAEIVRSYQSLMQLVSEIRTFLIINDLVGINQPPSSTNGPAAAAAAMDPQLQQQRLSGSLTSAKKAAVTETNEKLIKLRDEMSMFLYELEIPLP